MTIRTPDQRLRVFVSSTLSELARERDAARRAITNLRLTPVLFELGARPHPPKELYLAYLAQSHIFIGIYWQKYGWVAPDMTVSGIEDEYNSSHDIPKLIYIKSPAPDREPRLQELLHRIQGDNVSYIHFSTPDELQESIENDLALILTERFEQLAAGVVSEPPVHPPSNIPIPRNPLVGRDRELEIACELLQREDVPLMTLTGPGGTGKSRLGLHVALELLDDFKDGAYLVDLTPISDPELIIPTIAETIDLSEELGGGELYEHLKEYLRARQMLLFLDNFEQVVPAAPLIAELVETCTRLKIMLTSRVPLRVRMERVLFVPPLALPDLRQKLTPARIARYPAVELFVQRARILKPGFTLDSQNARTIAEICHRLDGLPLAIELAAARINILSPKSLLAKLDHSLAILTSGGRDLPGRQKTLRRAIGWSYDLLDDPAQALFRRLSVFAGGWTLDAAQAVCGPGSDPGFDLMENMQQLIESSLVTSPVERFGELRFGFLQTIQEFSSGLLAASKDEEGVVRHQHAQYYLELVEHTTRDDTVPDTTGWSDVLEVEHDNLRAALSWSIEALELECALRLCLALKNFWLGRSYISEGRLWLAWTLDRLKEVDAESLPIMLRADAFTAAGTFARVQGDLTQANQDHRLALELRRRSGDEQAVGNSLNNLGVVAIFQGEYDSAKQLLEESLGIARQSGDERGTVRALNNLGVVEMYRLDFEHALKLHEEVHAIYQAAGDRSGMAGALGNMGDVLRYQGDYARAQAVLQESLEIFREEHEKHDTAITLGSMGRVALCLKDGARGAELYRESLSLLREVGDRVAIADCLEGLAISCRLEAGQMSVESQRDCLQRGLKMIAAADALRSSVGSPVPPTDRPEYDATLEAIRDQINPHEYKYLWHEGRSMTMEHAIAFALGEENPEDEMDE